MPTLTATDIADVNHYTIAMSRRRGAEQLGVFIRNALARTTQDADTRASQGSGGARPALLTNYGGMNDDQ